MTFDEVQARLEIRCRQLGAQLEQSPNHFWVHSLRAEVMRLHSRLRDMVDHVACAIAFDFGMGSQ